MKHNTKYPRLNSITQEGQQEEWILNMTIEKLRLELRKRIGMIEQLRSERDILINTLGSVNKSCASENLSI